jgi:hypothetical protein
MIESATNIREKFEACGYLNELKIKPQKRIAFVQVGIPSNERIILVTNFKNIFHKFSWSHTARKVLGNFVFISMSLGGIVKLYLYKAIAQRPQ